MRTKYWYAAIIAMMTAFAAVGQRIRVENVYVPQDSVIRSYPKSGIVTYNLIYPDSTKKLGVWLNILRPDDSTGIGVGEMVDKTVTGDIGDVLPGRNKKIRWRFNAMYADAGWFDAAGGWRIKIYARDSIEQCGQTSGTYIQQNDSIISGSRWALMGKWFNLDSGRVVDDSTNGDFTLFPSTGFGNSCCCAVILIDSFGNKLTNIAWTQLYANFDSLSQVPYGFLDSMPKPYPGRPMCGTWDGLPISYDTCKNIYLKELFPLIIIKKQNKYAKLRIKQVKYLKSVLGTEPVFCIYFEWGYQKNGTICFK